MNEILKELAGLLGLNKKELDEIFSEGTVKVNVNGEPVVNIENGVDKLSKKDAPKKEESKKEESTPCVTKTSCPKETKTTITDSFYTTGNSNPHYTSPKVEYNKPCVEAEPVVKDKNVWITKDLLMLDKDDFVAIHKINGVRLAGEQTEISFAHYTPDGWWGGVTEEQLLRILLYRFKDDPVKSDLIKRLLTV